MFRRLRLLAAVFVLVVGLGAQSARADDQPTLSVTVFAAPSQSIWIPTLIQKAALDAKHGFKLNVTPKPANVAYQDFASGADRVCYCASVSAVARFVEQGAKISLLWNIFDYDYYVVAADPKLTKAKDLEGRSLMTDTVTGSWAMGSWLLQSSGLDLSKVQIQSASTVGATGLALLTAGRVDAVVSPREPVSTFAILHEN